jgi:hypothetical protein
MSRTELVFGSLRGETKMGRFWLLSSLLFLFGCKDKPYIIPMEGPAAQQGEYFFSGTAELGTPLSGATVCAYKFSGLQRGEKLTEVITGPDGTYDLKIITEYDGPVLLAASGGTYRDLATKETVALKPSQELTSAITHIKMPEKTNINAWTTLAVARVLANQGFWDKSVAELQDIDRINVDFTHMSYFLTGESPAFVNIRRHDYFDAEKDTFKPDEPKSILHLANGGLSRLASDFSARLAEEGVVVSVADLVLALADDLSDRIFDGHNATGNVVYVGNNRRINLNSYTMRKQLSEAILLYLEQLKGLGKLTDEDKNYIEKPGSLIDSLTKKTQAELFPEADAPKPIDKEPPTLIIHFGAEHSKERPFSFLSGNVTFDIEANDDTKVAQIRMLEPKVVGVKAGNNLYGPILVNQPPQAMAAAEACGKKAELTEEINKRELSETSLICACFEAVDIFGNGKKELSCFQRAMPKAIVTFPTNETVLSSTSFNDQVKVVAKVVGGLPLTACSWRVRAELEGRIGEGILPEGKGIIDGTTCAIDEALDGSKFINGNYVLVVEATDTGGRVLSDKSDGIYQSLVNFQVYMEPPAVEVITPANNAYLSMDFIPITGTVKNQKNVKEIIAEYWGSGKDNNGLKGKSSIGLDPDNEHWVLNLGKDLPAGEYAFDLLVKDIYGNEKKLPSRNVTIDSQAPTILGALDGVPQTPYLQETVNYRQRYIDEPGRPHYVIEPLGEAVPVNWQRAPKIHRWLTRLNDWQTAPSYTIRATDDNNLKEVRYKLNFKCSNLVDADKKAPQQDDRFNIWLTQSTASFDLARDSEVDGHTQKYCLSIWAIDQAGNASNHNVEFIWKVIAPPVSIEMNAHEYRAHLREDDVLSRGRSIPELFRKNAPVELKNNIVIGHGILFNPHSEPVSAKLNLTRPMELSLHAAKYPIGAQAIDIRYFAYDMVKRHVGPERTLQDQTVIMNANEAILAKFVLTKNAVLEGMTSLTSEEWNKLRIAIDFVKTGVERPMVDGLRLITRDSSVGDVVNEFLVSWGDSHDVRRRSPPVGA